MVQWFSFLSPRLWWMRVIYSDNETVWPELWPQNKYRSTRNIFHDLVILLYIFKIIWWMNIIVGKMDQCDTKTDLINYMWIKDLILWSSDFDSYLEDYLMEKCCTWDKGSVWHQDQPRKIYVGQWPIFQGPFILPYIIVIDLNYFYTLRNGACRVFVPL